MKIFPLLITFLFCITSFCEAHTSIGYKPERTDNCIRQVEAYFRDNYHLSLKNDITVYVTKSFKEYQSVLERCNVPNAKELTRNSYAVTSKNNTILINGSGLSDKHFFFILAHEMVHRYQFENYNDPHGDYVLLEGLADNIASKISGYYIETQDHDIPYEELKSREQFFTSCKNRRNDTLEQIRYYTKDLSFK